MYYIIEQAVLLFPNPKLAQLMEILMYTKKQNQYFAAVCSICCHILTMTEIHVI